MGRDDFTVPDDLTELLGPAPVSTPTHGTPPGAQAAPFPPSPRNSSGAPGASSRAQLATGRMLFGRRLSEEQRALREQAKAEESVGRLLDRLTRVGDRVLHDRRAPGGHGQVDHIVITTAGVHFIETLPVSDRRQLWIDLHGSPRVGQLPLRQRLDYLVDLAGALADQTNAALRRSRGLLVYPLVAVVGGSAQHSTTVQRVDLVSIGLVPAWMHRLPAVHDPLDVAAITEAVAQLCPPYLPGPMSPPKV